MQQFHSGFTAPQAEITIPIGGGRRLVLSDLRVWPFLLATSLSYVVAYRSRSWMGFFTTTTSALVYWSAVIDPTGTGLIIDPNAPADFIEDDEWSPILPSEQA